jgi:hypothetical protein
MLALMLIILFFSAIDYVERKFEDLLSAIGNVDFMGLCFLALNLSGYIIVMVTVQWV